MHARARTRTHAHVHARTRARTQLWSRCFFCLSSASRLRDVESRLCRLGESRNLSGPHVSHQENILLTCVFLNPNPQRDGV